LNQKFRIKSPTIALFAEEGRQVAHIVPAGSIIAADSTSGDDLIEVSWEGQPVLTFAQDLRDRGDSVEEIPSR